jgi:hypothetical protein
MPNVIVNNYEVHYELDACRSHQIKMVVESQGRKLQAQAGQTSR